MEYYKFLGAKLYLIESISLKRMLAGDEEMKKIHDICLASYSQIEDMLNSQNKG